MRKVLLFLQLTLLASSLGAEALRVGLYGVPSYLEEDLKASFSSFTEAGLSSERLEEIQADRLEKAAEKAARQNDHRNLVGEKEREEEKEFTYDGFDSVSYVTVSPDERIKTLFEDLDERALSYTREREELDILLIFSSVREGQLEFLDSHVFDGELRPFISNVSIVNEGADLYDAMMEAFRQLYFGDAGFIRREGGRLKAAPSGDVEIDGVVYTVEAGSTIDVAPVPVSREEKTFTLFSTPSDAMLSVFALDSVRLPLSVSSDEENIILALTAPGFMSRTYQLSAQSAEVVALSLKPEWMGREGRVRDAKDAFYRALRDSFLSFSLYAISTSLCKIYPDETKAWGPLLTTFTAGVSVVSLMNLIKTCGAYYNCAKETYL